jgi:hypothetical protein
MNQKMIGARWSVLAVALAALSVAGCASTRASRAEATPSRVQDTLPERKAAQRAGAPASLELEDSDERWGIEAARERRDAEKAAKANTTTTTTNPPGSKTVVPEPPRAPAPPPTP